MKWIKEAMILIACIIAVMYVLFSLGLASFDFTAWPEKPREMMAAFGGMFSLFVAIIQMFRANSVGDL